MICLACSEREIAIGVLCAVCAARACGPAPLCPEQIVSFVEHPLGAGLVDCWGRLFPLQSPTVIGRRRPGADIAVIEPSISRQHASIAGGGEAWHVRDLGSSNGTRLNDHSVLEEASLRSGDALRFGDVGFLFLADVPSVDAVATKVATVKPARPIVDEPSVPRIQYSEDGGEDASAEQDTFLGLRQADLELESPHGGGGGVLSIDGKVTQLSLVQFELFQLLMRRMMEESGRDERVRGFVRSSELLGSLSWDTPRPEDNHMKQLIRRLRRSLARAGIADLIESRHGFGYRLAVLPRAPSSPR